MITLALTVIGNRVYVRVIGKAMIKSVSNEMMSKYMSSDKYDFIIFCGALIIIFYFAYFVIAI